MVAHSSVQYMSESRTTQQEFGGKTWKFSLARIKHYSEKAEYIKNRCGNPLRMIQQIPPEMTSAEKESLRNGILTIALGLQTVTEQDAEIFDNSLEGMGYNVYRALRDHHEELGKLKPGQESVYTVADGETPNHYAVDQERGVELGIRWMEEFCTGDDDAELLMAVLRSSHEKDIVPNFDGLMLLKKLQAKLNLDQLATPPGTSGRSSSENSDGPVSTGAKSTTAQSLAPASS